MKKLVYYDKVGQNPRKREVSIEENTFLNDLDKVKGPDVLKKRIYKYFVKEKFVSDSPEKLEAWIRGKKTGGSTKNCHVLRKIDTKTGDNMIMCKILGTFHIIYGKTAYEILYLNEIKICLSKK